jgi:hypothetical protein
VAIGLSIFNFIWIIAIPHWYYGWVRGTLYWEGKLSEPRNT